MHFRHRAKRNWYEYLLLILFLNKGTNLKVQFRKKAYSLFQHAFTPTIRLSHCTLVSNFLFFTERQQLEGIIWAFKGENQPTVLPSNDDYKLQKWPAWHEHPKAAVVAHIPWQLPTTPYLDVRPVQQGWNHIWYWKPSQTPRAYEVVDLGRETDLLKQA